MQPGQIVGVTCDVASVPFVRAIARSAYERGALFVDPWYFDGRVKRARIELADPETLEFAPRWYGERYLELFGTPQPSGVRVGLVEAADVDEVSLEARERLRRVELRMGGLGPSLRPRPGRLQARLEQGDTSKAVPPSAPACRLSRRHEPL